ncbi:MAG: dihydroorotase [Gammaproteobacteria bacterium]|nr:MAG: dihydroorotase [Gammaproteobacteria bacterium]RLA24570.1 MAG: dihydroorotase [Gammaproteobacteria bacterium]
MGMSIMIENGRVIDPANQVDVEASLYVADGKVLSLGTKPEGFVADRTIDASGQVVCPGFVDLCTRLREPGLEHKGTIASETKAAVSAGFTTLCCPPDTDPVIDTPAVANLIQERAQLAGSCCLLPIGALTKNLEGDSLSEMGALQAAGCLAVSNAGSAIKSTLILRRAMEYAATYDLLVIIRPEDQGLSAGGFVHEGAVSARLGLPGIPDIAETTAVAQALELIRHTGVRAHFGQLSSVKAARMIGRARHEGVPVSADVSAHQLFLSELDISGYNAQCHVRPPLRAESDREGLRLAVAEGVIGAICSDHQPHESDAKLDLFQSTEPGIAGLETVLPLLLKLVDDGVLELNDAIARLTAGPADILGFECGQLKEGSPADVTIFDPQKQWQVGDENWLSAGRNNPFNGQIATGQVTLTLQSGRVVFDRNS